ncbi:MAG: RNA 3'-terminal phosphate cyclase [Desulfurococcaceae archaeon]
MDLVEINGSMGEGGGQILRYSLSLSALTLKPVRVFNIRAKRDNPGLRPQHLTAVKALAMLTNASVRGDYVGSMEIVFEPKERLSGCFKLDIGTAGSISLVIQAILPELVFSDRDSRLEITGGTDVAWSPPIDYMRFVFKHNLSLIGIDIDIDLRRRGHYPRGGGVVVVYVKPVKDYINSINIVESKGVLNIKGLSHAVKLPRHVAERQASSALKYIEEKLGLKPVIDIESYPLDKDPHLGPGSGIVLYSDTKSGTRLGSDSLGERGKRAEDVGLEAAEKLVSTINTGMAFDKHMGDMFIPYLFLTRGESCIGVSEITLHTLTAISVARKFMPDVEVNVVGEEGSPGKICIKSTGFKP